jgi:signal recognition particle subunit SRP54
MMKKLGGGGGGKGGFPGMPRMPFGGGGMFGMR